MKTVAVSVLRHAEYAVMKTTKQEVLMAVEEKCQEYNHFQQVHKVSA